MDVLAHDSPSSSFDELREQLWDGVTRSPNSPDFTDGWRLADVQVEEGLVFIFRRDRSDLPVEVIPPGSDVREPYLPLNWDLSRMMPGTNGVALPPEEQSAMNELRKRLGRLRLSPAFSLSRPARRTSRIRPVRVSRALTRSGTPWIEHGLNPYVGCLLGCSFCYAKTRVEFVRALSGSPQHDWGGFVDVKINLPDVLREELRAKPPGRIAISPIITDPYQSVEKRFRITRKCLEVIAESPFSVSILTREPEVLQDAALIRTIHAAEVGLSFSTDDESLMEILEPRTSSLAQRVEALKTLRETGIPTFAFFQPLLPMKSPEQLADRIGPLIRWARIEPLHHSSLVSSLLARAGRSGAASLEHVDATRAALVARLMRWGVEIRS